MAIYWRGQSISEEQKGLSWADEGKTWDSGCVWQVLSPTKLVRQELRGAETTWSHILCAGTNPIALWANGIEQSVIYAPCNIYHLYVATICDHDHHTCVHMYHMERWTLCICDMCFDLETRCYSSHPFLPPPHTLPASALKYYMYQSSLPVDLFMDVEVGSMTWLHITHI